MTTTPIYSICVKVQNFKIVNKVEQGSCHEILGKGTISDGAFQTLLFVSLELFSERDYVIIHSVHSMYACTCMSPMSLVCGILVKVLQN